MVYGPLMAPKKPQEDPRTVRMTDEMLLCRDLGHSWPRGREALRWEIHERTSTNMIATVRREVSCTECQVVREDIYEYPSFHLLSRHYTYPRGYLANNAGLTALQRRDYRFTLFGRAGVK